jgi:small-conductance mechanosensitive channel
VLGLICLAHPSGTSRPVWPQSGRNTIASRSLRSCKHRLRSLNDSLLRFALEEDVYRHFHLASGVPYAISTMLHYVILLLGFFVAFSALGIDLTKLTILVGAFSVGIGFGLRNVINNFVSGLILLFERPIKIGDVIEVGGNVGGARRIGIRASVIRTADGIPRLCIRAVSFAERALYRMDFNPFSYVGAID